MKLCYSTTLAGFPIHLQQQGKDRFAVTYGVQHKRELTYGEAATELGQCIMDALAREGKLNNRECDERLSRRPEGR